MRWFGFRSVRLPKGSHTSCQKYFKKQSENIPYGIIFDLESTERLKQVKSMPEFSKYIENNEGEPLEILYLSA